jgi:hypothetical protein
VKTTNCAIAVSAIAALIAAVERPTSTSRPPNPNYAEEGRVFEPALQRRVPQEVSGSAGRVRRCAEYQGKRYASSKPRVYLNSADRTTVTLLEQQGKDLQTFSFRPGPSDIR